MFFSVQLFAPLAATGIVVAWTVGLSRRFGKRARAVLVLLLPIAWWQVFMVREMAFGVVPALLDARAADVRAVILDRPDDKLCRPYLVDRPVRIPDRAAVEQVVALLHASELGSKGRRSGPWCARVGLEYDDRTVSGTVEGAYFTIDRSHWRLAERRQDALAPALARLVEAR